MVHGGKGREQVSGSKLTHKHFKCQECGREHDICYIKYLGDISSRMRFPLSSYQNIADKIMNDGNVVKCTCGTKWRLEKDNNDYWCWLVPDNESR